MGMGWCDVGTTCKILYSSTTETAYKQNAIYHDKGNAVGGGGGCSAFSVELRKGGGNLLIRSLSLRVS